MSSCAGSAAAQHHDAGEIQYPFSRLRLAHISMLVGGTGINPMIQALHAILGTPGNTTKVTLLYGNKTQVGRTRTRCPPMAITLHRARASV